MNASSLATRIREVILNGKWIANTNLKEQLENLPLQSAKMKIGEHNSVAALAFHIHYYVKGVMKVLQGGPLDIKDQYSFDMPELNSEAQWRKMVEDIFSDAETFAAEIEKLTDEQLARDFVNPKYGSVGRNINAIIEHSYYHLGQIVLIRKLIEAQK